MKATFMVLFAVLLSTAIGCLQKQLPPFPPADLAPAPSNYQEIVTTAAKDYFIDPESARFRFYAKPPTPCTAVYSNTTPAYQRGLVGKMYQGQCGIVFVNAKNRMGGYAGERPYLYIFNGHRMTIFDGLELFDFNPEPW